MNLRDALRHEPVTHLDLSHFCKIDSGTPVRDVIDVLRQGQQNCAFIIKDGKLAGIFTDRDVMQKIVDRPDALDSAVDEWMTPEPLKVSVNAAAADAMSLMEEYRFRNVPVVDKAGAVVGNLTHYSVLELLAASFPAEVYNRPPNPTRFARRRHGG